MKKIIFIILIHNSLFAQNQLLAIKIDTIITAKSSKTEREFKISYQIENLANEPISFFLDPDMLRPNAVASMALCPNYKIYENDNFIDVDGVFEKYIDDNQSNFNIENSEYLKKLMNFMRKKQDSTFIEYKKNGGTSNDTSWVYLNKSLLKYKMILQPKQVFKKDITVNWNKKRYFKIEDNEYYLDEKNYYYFQIGLILLKTEIKDRLTNQEFENIKNDKKFVDGVFSSNKFKIDFGEF